MSCHYPFHTRAVLAAAALAAAALLAPAMAQTAQQAALGDARAEAPKPEAAKSEAPRSESAKPAEAPAASTSANAAPQNNPAQKSIAVRAVDRMKDMFARVPCLPPKGAGKSTGSLPHVANKLIAGQPVTIIAFGSSSTQGFGSTAPEFNYPNRLAAQLKRHYPTADII